MNYFRLYLIAIIITVGAAEGGISQSYYRIPRCAIDVKLVTADCLFAGTMAEINLYFAKLATIDMRAYFDTKYDIGTITRIDGPYPIEKHDRSDVNAVVVPCTVLDDLEECVFNDTAPCFPTADVFFINITMNPKDPFPSWSPIYLDLTVDFIMKNFRYLRHYEFVNVFRCDLWIKESGIYQLGPRHGLVLKHKSMPTVGTWLRTWV